LDTRAKARERSPRIAPLKRASSVYWVSAIMEVQGLGRTYLLLPQRVEFGLQNREEFVFLGISNAEGEAVLVPAISPSCGRALPT
jgi:hypothetical protein